MLVVHTHTNTHTHITLLCWGAIPPLSVFAYGYIYTHTHSHARTLTHTQIFIHEMYGGQVEHTFHHVSERYGVNTHHIHTYMCIYIHTHSRRVTQILPIVEESSIDITNTHAPDQHQILNKSPNSTHSTRVLEIYCKRVLSITNCTRKTHLSYNQSKKYRQLYTL